MTRTRGQKTNGDVMMQEGAAAVLYQRWGRRGSGVLVLQLRKEGEHKRECDEVNLGDKTKNLEAHRGGKEWVAMT